MLFSDKIPHTFFGQLGECHEGPVRAVAFNKDAHYCLTCGADRIIALWNPHRLKLIKKYTGHSQEVLDADAAQDNSKIVSCGMDRLILLTDVSTGKVLRKYRGHEHRVNCVTFNNDSSVIVSGSYDKTTRIWDCRDKSNEAVQVLDEASDSISSIDLTDYEIVTSSIDGVIRIYDIRAGQLHLYNVKHPTPCVKNSHDRHCILAASLDANIRLIDKTNGEIMCTYTGHRNEDYKVDIAFTPTDSYVVSGSENGKIHFWDLMTKEIKTTLVHGSEKSVVYSIDYCNEHSCMLTACSLGVVKVWKGENWPETETQ